MAAWDELTPLGLVWTARPATRPRTRSSAAEHGQRGRLIAHPTPHAQFSQATPSPLLGEGVAQPGVRSVPDDPLGAVYRPGIGRRTVTVGEMNARGRSTPNVMLIISDQHRADTMPGARTTATTALRTPHLDWLAERSTVFRRAFCTTPVCTPARSALLTGLYPHATGMVANHQDRLISRDLQLPANVRVLADYLRPLGYACAYSGCFHLGTWGDRRGFADFVRRAGDHDVDVPEANDIVRFCRRIGVELGRKHGGVDPDPVTYDPRRRTGASLLPLAFHVSMLDAQGLAHFIQQRRDDARPFLAVFSCHEPHPPFVSPRPFDAMYRPDELPLPETVREMAAAELLDRRRDRKLAGTASYTDEDLRAMRAAYFGTVSYVDHLVGTILAALIETDQFDDTLFIFTADHGEMLGSHGLLYKGAAFFDDLVNIPLLVKPPRGGLTTTSKHLTDRLVSHVDLVPTILRWCGAGVPAGLHGVNIRSLIEGGSAAVRDGVAFEYHSGNWGERPVPLRGWRTEDWKYVESQDGTDELYDLRADPGERHNLLLDDAATRPDAVAALARLRAALHVWLHDTGDPWPQIPMPPALLPEGALPLGRAGHPGG